MAHIHTGHTGVEAMSRFIPAGFEASSGVWIALLGLCLRSGRASSERNGDVAAYFALLKKAVEYFFRFESRVLHWHFSQAVHIMHRSEQRETQELSSSTLRCWLWAAASEPQCRRRELSGHVFL